MSMRKIILVLLLLGTCISELKAQSIMTQITTGKDNMESSKSVKFNWGKIKVIHLSYSSKMTMSSYENNCTEIEFGVYGPTGNCNCVGACDHCNYCYSVVYTTFHSCDGGGGMGGDNTGNGSGNGSSGDGPGGGGGGPSGTGTGTGNTTTTPVTAPPTISIALDSDVIIKTLVKDTTRKDTVKLTKKPCDSGQIARGQLATSIMNAIDTTPEIKKIRDSAVNGIFESGVSVINDTADKYRPYRLVLGDSQHVAPATKSLLHKIVATVHSHPVSRDSMYVNINSPSLDDVYNLLTAHIGDSINTGNSDYNIVYVISGDGTEWALMMDSPLNAKNFLQQYPMDSAYDAKNVDWSNNFIDSTTGRSLQDNFKSIKNNLLYRRHYPNEIVEALANVLMLNQQHNSGIKLLKKENGAFKELSFNPSSVDKDGNSEMKICQ